MFGDLRTVQPINRNVNESAPTPRARWLAPAALAVALLSLALNGVLLWTLRNPERLLAPALGRAVERLKTQDATLKYTVRVNTTLPIDTDFNLPVNTPFGNRNVRVPVRANIPIRTNMPVHLRDTFRLRTRTEAEIVVPLEIPIRDLPLDALQKSLEP